ncbi:MAG: PTS glucose transporter subunit IIA, partial [Coprobacillus cateniformis]
MVNCKKFCMVLCGNCRFCCCWICINCIYVKNEPIKKSLSPNEIITSPVSGDVIDLIYVNDPLFANGIIGEGVAILSADEDI